MTNRMRRSALPLLLIAVVAAIVSTTPGVAAAASRARATASPVAWQDRPTGSTERFRGLAPVSAAVAWVSGTGGTVLRTADGGSTWADLSPGVVDGFDTSKLQFRDIQAFSASTAVILAIGTGIDSRIYRTDDGGLTWRTTFVNAEPTAFYDCLAFFDRRNGLALSDPVDGKFRLQRTTDGGRSWSLVDPAGMPAALDGEFAFAASGTCLVTARGGNAWIASGGGAIARVLSSTDLGATWTATATPMRVSETGGIFSLAFRNPKQGVAVGGDFQAPTDGTDAAATSRDGGLTWSLARHALSGYRSGVAWLPGGARSLVAVGPTGSDVSRDSGRSWSPLDSGSLDSIGCARGACWGSGDAGRVAVLTGLG